MYQKFTVILVLAVFVIVNQVLADAQFAPGELRWGKPSYFLFEEAEISLTDPKLNQDRYVQETYAIRVWSDSDAGGIVLKIKEDGTDSDFFKTTLFFTINEDSDEFTRTLRVSDGDTLTARFGYEQLSKDNPGYSELYIYDTSIFVEENTEKDVDYIFKIEEVEKDYYYHGEIVRFFGIADSYYYGTEIKVEISTWDYRPVTTFQTSVEQDGKFIIEIDSSEPPWKFSESYRVKAKLGNTGYVDEADFYLDPSPEELATLDFTPPIIIVPKNMIVNSTVPIAIEFTAKAVDDEDGIIEVSCDPPSHSIFPVGKTEVKCEAHDSSGNGKSEYFFVTVEDRTLRIPAWVRNVAEFWTNDEIDDEGFIQVIQYLIEHKVIIIPIPETSEDKVIEIPSWIKTNAEFWINGQISDQDFATGIEWLINNGIIKI